MNLLRKLLLPIVPVYYFVTWLRNKLYDLGIKKSTTYEFPIIAVGNLSVGGTGKSPMVEYLIELLKDRVRLATLSRGYKRETKGFQLVKPSSLAREIGDEPLQFKIKFNDVTVAVDEDRRNGIVNLRSDTSKPEVILLDDAYQHRKVKAGFYVLLTSFSDLYVDDIVLPTGNLREPKRGSRRADIIVVTKCPKNLKKEDRDKISKRLKIKTHQKLFFTTIDYGNEIMSATHHKRINYLEKVRFTLVTGIANPEPLVAYYTSLGLKFDHINYPDHYNFTDKDLEKLKTHKCIVTTEKDYVRLISDFSGSELWYQPIKIKFLEGEDIFKNKIIDYIKK